MQTPLQAPGVTPPPDGPRHQFLSDSFVARGLVTESQMNAALDAARTGGSYSQVLMQRGAITEEDLARTLAAHHRIEHVDLDTFPVDPAAVALVPAPTARRLGAVPIATLPDGEVVLAIHDPDALDSAGQLAAHLGRPIRPVVASKSQIQRLMGEASPPAAAERVEAPAPDLQARLAAAEERNVRASQRISELEKRLAAAERHAEGMVASAKAANDALGVLTDQLAAERAERQALQERLEPPPPPPPAGPPPSVPPPVEVQAAQKKARGLRRMIAALKR